MFSSERGNLQIPTKECAVIPVHTKQKEITPTKLLHAQLSVFADDWNTRNNNETCNADSIDSDSLYFLCIIISVSDENFEDI